MKFAAIPFSVCLLAFTALAADHLHRPRALNNAGSTREKRLAHQNFQHPELHKRAAQFLNEKTQGNFRYTIDVSFVDKVQISLSTARPYPKWNSTSERATQGFCPFLQTLERQGSSSSGMA